MKPPASVVAHAAGMRAASPPPDEDAQAVLEGLCRVLSSPNRNAGARLQALCTKKLLGCAHARVALVNMTSAVSCSMLVDGVHPSAAGAHAMALAWHRALVSATHDRGIAPLMVARGLSPLSGRAAVKPRRRGAARSRSVPVEVVGQK